MVAPTIDYNASNKIFNIKRINLMGKRDMVPTTTCHKN